jgi:hypothetical protein
MSVPVPTIEVARWNWTSDDEPSPQPNDSPSEFFQYHSSAVHEPFTAIVEDGIEVQDDDNIFECIDPPEEISQIFMEIREMYTPTSSSFGVIVEANASSKISWRMIQWNSFSITCSTTSSLVHCDTGKQ